jgi:hypothetical protein
MFTHNAESARGIAPRAAHRSGLEPLDSSGSCHRMKAAAFRQDRFGSSNGTVRLCPADQYFRPRGASACAFSLSTAGRFSSSVPSSEEAE